MWQNTDLSRGKRFAADSAAGAVVPKDWRRLKQLASLCAASLRIAPNVTLKANQSNVAAPLVVAKQPNYAPEPFNSAVHRRPSHRTNPCLAIDLLLRLRPTRETAEVTFPEPRRFRRQRFGCRRFSSPFCGGSSVCNQNRKTAHQRGQIRPLNSSRQFSAVAYPGFGR